MVRESAIESWLASFGLGRDLVAHCRHVLCALPDDVRGDLLEDGSFRICEYEPADDGIEVFVASPKPGRAGRCVVLSRRLVQRSVEFVRWVIAHELAHAYLRNGGRRAGEDPEAAADALAAAWGFPRPAWGARRPTI